MTHESSFPVPISAAIANCLIYAAAREGGKVVYKPRKNIPKEVDNMVLKHLELIAPDQANFSSISVYLEEIWIHIVRETIGMDESRPDNSFNLKVYDKDGQTTLDKTMRLVDANTEQIIYDETDV